MKPIRPPIRDDYTSSYTNNSTSSRLRPPLNTPNQNNNNTNNNNSINKPFQSKNNSGGESFKEGPFRSKGDLPNQKSQFSNNPKKMNSTQNDNEDNSYDNNNMDNLEETYKENSTPKHKTSQKHKTPESNYNINPIQIPRPNQYDEIYSNNEKLPYYETNIGTAPPHTTTFYSVKETQNSSCRYIRSTLNSVPISQSLLNETNLLFGICVQPFAEIPDYEDKIPIVQTSDEIFRCKQCKSYINNKYNISYSAQNKQVAICNLCQYENELDINNPGIKSEYLSSDYSSCPELTKPTIDFVSPKNFKSSKLFIPHYLFMIDISEYSYQLGLPSYVINSIKTNLDSIHNVENSYLGFSLYDSKNVYFFYIEKDDVRLTIVGDIMDPFCPISLKKLYLKINENKERIEQIMDKINSFIEEKNKNYQENRRIKQVSTITGAAIKSGVESLLENGGRVMIFTSNPCNHGFGACVSRDKFNKEKEPQKSNPFYPQHEKFVEIGEKAANNRIVVDQFIFMSNSYDLSTFSVVSNLSGGQIEFYNYSTDPNVINSLYEKLHYDLTRILTRPNYYECKFMLRFTVGVDCVEILGPFNKKLGEAFQLGGCDPDYCYYYNLRLNEYFKKGQKTDIQIVILFDDNYSNRYLRIFNFTFDMTNEVGNIFSNAEVDTITKAMIYKEISLIYKTDFKNVRQNLENKIINSFKYYRIKEKSSTPSNQLILPVSIRYLPLYIDSFLKTGILSNQNKPEMINQIIYIMNKLLRDPIYSTTKFLYPKFYRIDNIEREQINSKNTLKIENIGLINEKYNIIQKPLLLRLSKDIIDFDCAYLIDNGCYIYIFIFNHIEGNFYNDMFGVQTYEEAKNIVTNLDEENQSDINQRLLNIISQLRKENGGYFQPLRLFFFDESGIVNPILANLLKEDKLDEYDNYPGYLCNLHREIQERIDE